MQLIFEVTLRCPGRCRHCPVPKRDLSISLGAFVRAIRLFEALDPHAAVVLSGGEPTTLPSLGEYVRAAKEMGHPVTVATNGFCPERAIDSGADLIEVSVDYWGERHEASRGVKGLWERVVRILEYGRSVQARPRNNKAGVVIRSTLLPDNYRDLLRIRAEYPELPMLVMPVRGVRLSEGLRERMREQLEALSRLENVYVADSCPAGVSSFVLTPATPEVLEVLPCIFYRVPLGRLRDYTPSEVAEIVERGRRLPRFPCEA